MSILYIFKNSFHNSINICITFFSLKISIFLYIVSWNNYLYATFFLWNAHISTVFYFELVILFKLLYDRLSIFIQIFAFSIRWILKDLGANSKDIKNDDIEIFLKKVTLSENVKIFWIWIGFKLYFLHFTCNHIYECMWVYVVYHLRVRYFNISAINRDLSQNSLTFSYN